MDIVKLAREMYGSNGKCDRCEKPLTADWSNCTKCGDDLCRDCFGAGYDECAKCRGVYQTGDEVFLTAALKVVDEIATATGWLKSPIVEDMVAKWNNGIPFEVPGDFYQNKTPKLYWPPDTPGDKARREAAEIAAAKLAIAFDDDDVDIGSTENDVELIEGGAWVTARLYVAL